MNGLLALSAFFFFGLFDFFFFKRKQLIDTLLNAWASEAADEQIQALTAHNRYASLSPVRLR